MSLKLPHLLAMSSTQNLGNLMDKSLLPASIRFYEIAFKFETAEELLVILACEVFKRFHDRSLINKLIDLKHLELFSNRDAIRILKREIAPKIPITDKASKRGRKPNTKQRENRLRAIGHAAWYHHFMGAPKRNNPDLSKTKSACTIVSELYYCSESTAWSAMKKYYSQPMRRLAESDKLNGITRVFDFSLSDRVRQKIKTGFDRKYYRDFETIHTLLNKN